MEYKKLKEMVVDEDAKGVFAISFVESPAIKSDFIALSNQELKLKVTNKDQRIVTGAILIPDLPILRLDEENNPFHIFFSKETVQRLSEKYLQDHNQANVTLEHMVDVPDIVLTESWIVNDATNDKSNVLGLDAPTGSWVGSFKVNNDTIWHDLVKTGIVKGFSVEAVMKFKNTNLNEIKMENKDVMDNKTLFDKLVEFFSAKETEMTPEEIIAAPVVDLTEPEEKPQYVTKEVLDEFMTKVTEMLKPAEPTVVEEPKVEMKEVKEDVEMISLTEEVKRNEPFKWDGKLSTQDRIKLNLNND
jgi:hypothetical protein